MPRCSKDAKKSSRLQLENLYRTCRYCNANRPTNRFDKHQKACKTKWVILNERRTRKTKAAGKPEAVAIQRNEPEFVQGSSSMQVDMIDDLPGQSRSPVSLNATEQPGEHRFYSHAAFSKRKMCRTSCHQFKLSSGIP